MNIKASDLPHQVRRRNLIRVIKERFNDNLAECARALQRSENYLWQLVSVKRTKAGKASSRPYRQMGERAARHIEERLKLNPGTLDKDLAVAFDRVIVAQWGVHTKRYVLAPRLDLGAELRDYLKGKTKKRTDTSTTPSTLKQRHLRPIPVDFETSERSFYVRMVGAVMDPLVRDGDEVFVDPEDRDLEHGALYLIDVAAWPSARVRQCVQLDGAWWFVACDQQTERLGYQGGPGGNGEGPAILGRVVAVSKTWRVRPGVNHDD